MLCCGFGRPILCPWGSVHHTHTHARTPIWSGWPWTVTDGLHSCWSRVLGGRWMKWRSCLKSSVESSRQSGCQPSKLHSRTRSCSAPFTTLTQCSVALNEMLSGTVFCSLLDSLFFLFSPFQLRDMCVQDRSVWTQVRWMPPRFLPLQQHWLSALPVSQPHQLLPPAVR